MTQDTARWMIEELALRLAGSAVSEVMELDESPRRPQHKAKIQIAIADAILDELISKEG
jgi:hypothetical protein